MAVRRGMGVIWPAMAVGSNLAVLLADVND
jgi:hypothetical protein